MNTEWPFRISVAVLMVALALVRFSKIGWATFGIRRSDEKIAVARSSKTWYAITLTTGWLWVLVPGVYIVAPGWLLWAALPIPPISRWIGVGLGVISIVWLGWAHRALGKNWNVPGLIQERQTLVTSGPYQWVRHPMYTSGAVIALAYSLISANWFVALIGLAYWILVFAMVGSEEATLIEKFGDSYREYMKHTGRFLPRLF